MPNTIIDTVCETEPSEIYIYIYIYINCAEYEKYHSKMDRSLLDLLQVLIVKKLLAYFMVFQRLISEFLFVGFSSQQPHCSDRAF